MNLLHATSKAGSYKKVLGSNLLMCLQELRWNIYVDAENSVQSCFLPEKPGGGRLAEQGRGGGWWLGKPRCWHLVGLG